MTKCTSYEKENLNSQLKAFKNELCSENWNLICKTSSDRNLVNIEILDKCYYFKMLVCSSVTLCSFMGIILMWLHYRALLRSSAQSLHSEENSTESPLIVTNLGKKFEKFFQLIS